MPRSLLQPSGIRCWLFASIGSLVVSTGCAAPVASGKRLPDAPVLAAEFQPNAFSGELTPAEARYVRQTAMTIYRAQPIERTRSFLPADDNGYRICLRSRLRGKLDHTLLTLQRRITDDFIPQAADDVIVDRSSAGTTVCRNVGNSWISLR